MNAVSEESIPYVHVYIKSLNKGTVSNLNGEFFLENVKLTDTLVFSFLYNTLFKTKNEYFRKWDCYGVGSLF